MKFVVTHPHLPTLIFFSNSLLYMGLPKSTWWISEVLMIVFQKSHCMNLQNEFIGEKIDIQVSVRISMRRSVSSYLSYWNVSCVFRDWIRSMSLSSKMIVPSVNKIAIWSTCGCLTNPLSLKENLTIFSGAWGLLAVRMRVISSFNSRSVKSNWSSGRTSRG